MFGKYLEFLKNCFTRITNGGDTVSFLDYLKAIGLALMMVGVIVFSLAIICFVFTAPVFCYRHKMRKLKTALQEALAEYSKEDWNSPNIKKARDKITAFKILYGIGIVVVYIPIAIPTVLFLTSALFHV